MRTRHIFEGKRITQVGLGLLGRGVGDAAFLAGEGTELLVTDLKSPEELAPSLAELKKYPSITFRLGVHYTEDLLGRDMVLKGAGVPFDATCIREAREVGIPIDMSASLFARIANIPIIGVTGTRGKSTVTHLIHAICTSAGQKTLLGGNVRGVSNLALLHEVTHESVGIFELDSWQCQGFGEERSLSAVGVRQGAHSPAIAVFTSFMPDHLNYYRWDMEHYLADKAHIFLHQTEGDLLVVGKQAYKALSPYRKRIRARVIVADETDVPFGWNIRLLGAHNRYNVGIAVAVAREYGIPEEVVREVVESFEPLPGRLQFIREAGGVRFYNDTNATTPEAVAASLYALVPDNKRNIILIAGGMDKGLDTSVMVSAVHDTCKFVLFLPGTGTDVFRKACVLEPETFLHVDSLREAVTNVWFVADPGDIVVLSPGFASHNLFKNEYDRGEQFEALVRAQ